MLLFFISTNIVVVINCGHVLTVWMCPETDFDKTNVILKVKQNVCVCARRVCVCVCVWIYKTSVVPSQHWNAALSKKTNQLLQLCQTFYLFILHRCLQHSFCPQYKTPEFSDRGRRNEKKTANSMRQTELNNAPSMWYSIQIRKTDFWRSDRQLKLSNQLENHEKEWALSSHTSRIRWR